MNKENSDPKTKTPEIQLPLVDINNNNSYEEDARVDVIKLQSAIGLHDLINEDELITFKSGIETENDDVNKASRQLVEPHFQVSSEEINNNENEESMEERKSMDFMEGFSQRKSNEGIQDNSFDRERVDAYEKEVNNRSENNVAIQTSLSDSSIRHNEVNSVPPELPALVRNNVGRPREKKIPTQSKQDKNRKPSKSKSPGGSSEPPKKDPVKLALETIAANERARSKSPLHPKHLFSVEVEQRKLTTPKAESPYLCRIIEIPPDESENTRSRSRPKKKLYVCRKDHRLLNDQLIERKHQREQQAEDDLILYNLVQQTRQSTSQPPVSPPLQTGSIPIKLWPNFDLCTNNGKETQTRDGIQFQDDDDFFQTNNSKVDVSLSSSSLSALGPPPPIPPKDDGENPDSLILLDNISPHSSSIEIKSLEDLAGKLELGIYGAHEACGVLIHTLFKQALGNPSALEKVLESKEFNEFLVSPNEIGALEKVSTLLQSTTKSINEYLRRIKETGIIFPSDTNFSSRSNQVISIESIKSLQLCAKSRKVSATASNVWSFVPPSSPEQFQLSLFYNPDSGEITQTITAQNHIFRTRYSTLPIEDTKIRTVVSANREQVGLPAFVNPNSLLDTISRCSSYAASRTTSAKMCTLRCSKKLATITASLSKHKYSVANKQFSKLNTMKLTLQKLNVFAGIVYQLSHEMANACLNIQSSVWNSMYVQDVLKFPRIPGYPNPLLRKECQIPSGTKIPVHEAMRQLTEGLKGIDVTLKDGLFLLEAIKYGIKPENQHKKFIQQFIQAVQTLGADKDIDYGSLLMTLLCSTEMINHFQDMIPSTDKFVRASILTHLGKINWGTAELLGAFQRMEVNSKLLSFQTISKLQQISKRQKTEKQ